MFHQQPAQLGFVEAFELAQQVACAHGSGCPRNKTINSSVRHLMSARPRAASKRSETTGWRGISGTGITGWVMADAPLVVRDLFINTTLT
jgi:hypothetical protein